MRGRKTIIVKFIILVLILSLSFPNYFILGTRSESCYSNPYYPSYLLLSNWKDISIWIPTGIQVINRELDCFPLYNASIRNIYLGGTGILNLTVCLGINTTKAYLQLNNTVLLECNNSVCIILPPYTNYLILMVNVKSPFNITIESNSSWLIQDNAYTNNVAWVISNGSVIINDSNLIISFQEVGKYYAEISILTPPFKNIPYLLTLNNNEVNSWLSKSVIPKNLPKSLLGEYYLSLLLIKDSQNPYLGVFASSPSPLYLYSWVRDSSFMAMALQEAGHYNTALKYWLWMANATSMGNGTWYTRYNFYTGEPCTTYAIPDLDSLGLFEIGVYNFYNLTHNLEFIYKIKPRLCEIIKYQTCEILKSPYHLIPKDLGPWETRLAYHFWTEALNDLGLYYMEKLGFNVSYETKLLNESILKYFWENGYFASALGSFGNVLYPLQPAIDSSTLLPLAMGYLPLDSNYTEKNLNTVVSNLTVNGGLSRFANDVYHYSVLLYDSCEPSPPWVVTTMFEALYYAKTGEINSSIRLLCWAYNHSQQGLLPEAVAPVKGYPLPTTSPHAWSSAMFIIVSLSLKPKTVSQSQTTQCYESGQTCAQTQTSSQFQTQSHTVQSRTTCPSAESQTQSFTNKELISPLIIILAIIVISIIIVVVLAVLVCKKR